MQLIVSAVHQLDDSRQFGFRFNLDMNGADVRVNGNGLTSMAEGVEDPDILAAIAASKQDHQGEEENDPAVLATIEASKQETVSEESASRPVEEKEPKKEISSCLQKSQLNRFKYTVQSKVPSNYNPLQVRSTFVGHGIR